MFKHALVDYEYDSDEDENDEKKVNTEPQAKRPNLDDNQENTDPEPSGDSNWTMLKSEEALHNVDDCKQTEKMCLDSEHVIGQDEQLKKENEATAVTKEIENAVTSITSENHSSDVDNTSPEPSIEPEKLNENNQLKTEKEEEASIQETNDENSSDVIKNSPQNVNNKNEDQIEISKFIFFK